MSSFTTGLTSNGAGPTITSTNVNPATSQDSPTSIPTSSSFPTVTSSPAPTSNLAGGIASSASLYLYTFLATLVLLLGVSSAIVVRSLMLRRRHRRMVEEAIRNGTWFPPTSGRNRNIDPSKKPKMFEAYISKADEADGPSKFVIKDEPEWDGIMPFSASYVNPPTNSKTSLLPETPGPARNTHVSRFASLAPWRRAVAPVLSSPSDTAVPDATPPTESTAAIAEPQLPSSVRVAVLIAMPTRSPAPNRLHTPAPDDEEELPTIEFGVTEINISEGGSGHARGKSMSSDAGSREDASARV